MNKKIILAVAFAAALAGTSSIALAAGSPAAIQAATAKLAADQTTLASAQAAVTSATANLAAAQTKLASANQTLIAARSHPQNYAAYRMAALQQLSAQNAVNAATTALNTAKASLASAQALVANDSAVLAALSA